MPSGDQLPHKEQETKKYVLKLLKVRRLKYVIPLDCPPRLTDIMR